MSKSLSLSLSLFVFFLLLTIPPSIHPSIHPSNTSNAKPTKWWISIHSNKQTYHIILPCIAFTFFFVFSCCCCFFLSHKFDFLFCFDHFKSTSIDCCCCLLLLLSSCCCCWWKTTKTHIIFECFLLRFYHCRIFCNNKKKMKNFFANNKWWMNARQQTNKLAANKQHFMTANQMI